MDFSHPSSSLPYVKKLIWILAPYASWWHAWIRSGASFLDENEITILTNFLRYGTHDKSCMELNIHTQVAEYILSVSEKKLTDRFHEFREWKRMMEMELKGNLHYSSEKERFLHSRIEFLRLPADLKIVLAYFPEKTIAGILEKYTEENLRKFWFMNTRALAIFRHVLRENKCLDLLR